MKTLVVYDSVYGNTEKIAKAIAGAITGEVKAIRVGEEFNPSELKGIDLFIAGSPTQGGRPTKAFQAFLDEIPYNALKGISVAAFDTRLSTRLARIFGYAAGRIARALEKKGGNLVVPPEGFLVTGTEGPLAEGEVERAGAWARAIPQKAKTA